MGLRDGAQIVGIGLLVSVMDTSDWRNIVITIMGIVVLGISGMIKP